CFGLRWFTPANEVPLCGHATLASAAVLFHIQKNPNPVLTFVTLSGELKARQVEDHIVLDLPLYTAYPQVMGTFSFVSFVLHQAAVGDMSVQDVRYSPDTKNLLVCLSDAYERSLLLNFMNVFLFFGVSSTLVFHVGSRSVLIQLRTSMTDGNSFRKNQIIFLLSLGQTFLWSTHAVLSSYWSEKLGKKEMLAFQCSRRGGELKISLRSDGRVDIAGQTAVVLQGNLTF
ncbi:PBLD protein, partial [Tyrannus savana]|nr:PBLD protein [Tyrannus savana]